MNCKRLILLFTLSLNLLILVNGRSLRPTQIYYNYRSKKIYPESLITLDNFTNFYVLDIPYCKTSFCKMSKLDSNNLRIDSNYNFRLKKTIYLDNAEIDKTVIRNSFNGMTAFIPKNTRVEVDTEYKTEYKEKVKNNDYNLYVSPGVKVEDVDENIEYSKNPDASSGYLNKRGQWINY